MNSLASEELFQSAPRAAVERQATPVSGADRAHQSPVRGPGSHLRDACAGELAMRGWLLTGAFVIADTKTMRLVCPSHEGRGGATTLAVAPLGGGEWHARTGDQARRRTPFCG